MSRISEATWKYEKSLDIKTFDLTGHYPEGNEPGAKFLTMVLDHAETDLKETGNLKRFDANHCPYYDRLVSTILESHPVAATATITCRPVCPPSPVTPSCPVQPGTPGGPPTTGTVPEPPGLALVGIGLIICMIGGRIVGSKRRQAEKVDQ